MTGSGRRGVRIASAFLAIKRYGVTNERRQALGRGAYCCGRDRVGGGMLEQRIVQ